MDAIQKQVMALSHKVDGLHQVIEQLDKKVSEALSENQPTNGTGGQNLLGTSHGRQRYTSQNSIDSSMEHKDVLIDVNDIEQYSHQSSEKDLSPEIQIQRLTAQLTAAYNRIAALEEQLLARRIHS